MAKFPLKRWLKWTKAAYVNRLNPAITVLAKYNFRFGLIAVCIGFCGVSNLFGSLVYWAFQIPMLVIAILVIAKKSVSWALFFGLDGFGIPVLVIVTPSTLRAVLLGIVWTILTYVLMLKWPEGALTKEEKSALKEKKSQERQREDEIRQERLREEQDREERIEVELKLFRQSGQRRQFSHFNKDFSTKKSYSEKSIADLVADRQGNEQGRKMNSYNCPSCERWHVGGSREN